MGKYYTIPELRRMLTARDKALVGERPLPEAVKLLKEKYGADEKAALAYASYQKSLASGGEATSGPSKPNEKWHLTYDDAAGKWVKVPQPDDHPPGAGDAQRALEQQ